MKSIPNEWNHLVFNNLNYYFSSNKFFRAHNLKDINIISVVGARPNFMKMAPIHKALNKIKYRIDEKNHKYNFRHLICHTGQHYDKKMSDIFFKDLELPKPNFYLGVGSGSHAEQTAKIMIEFEKVLIKVKPKLIIVYGDVNSTVACSLVASKMGIKIAHVESGLRSFDKTMPEEINRILTDHLSDFLFVTEQSGMKNLKNEGISKEKIFFVGNTMIDSLVRYNFQTKKSKILKSFNIDKSKFILVTLHRPSNVDDCNNLKRIIALLNQLAEGRKIIFPVHPRTRMNINKNDLKLHQNLLLTEPIGYIDFLALMINSELVFTDSGGIQEETTYLKVPCVTLRENTERPSTVKIGTNQLVGKDLFVAEKVIMKIINGKIKKSNIPELWDGKSAERIKKILSNKFIMNFN